MLSLSPIRYTLLLTLSILLLQNFLCATATRCHSDDENGLLAFKFGIRADPSNMLGSWKPGTDCCTWAWVTCRGWPDKRVTRLYIFGRASSGANMLSGNISPSLAKLEYLDSLLLRDLGNLTGPFPDFVFSLPSIEVIYITNSRLYGPIPTLISNLTNLNTLVLSGNLFSSRIPVSVGNLTELIRLDLSGNRFSGTIPTTIEQLTNLFELNLGGNMLSGAIPDIFSAFGFLKILNLSNNMLTRSIPKSISYLQPTDVDLAHNALSGQVPEFSDLSEVRTLNLSKNLLSGNVPTSYKSFSELTKLDLSYNFLNGSFPEMVHLSNLHTLDLSYNRFHFGKVPEWISNTSMHTLKLAKCGIKMKLNDWKPTAFYINIDLSENQITGNPLQLFNNTRSLMWFRASYNRLRFNMTHMKIRKLKSLDLSHNLVFGNVTKAVSSLEELNVSYNHLCGPLPDTMLPADAFIGNDCLCGAPLQPCGT